MVFSGALGRILLPEGWYIIFERRESKLARNSSFCKHLLFIQKASLSHSKILKMDTGEFEKRRQQALYNRCSTERVSTSRGTPDSCNHHNIYRCIYGSDCPLHSVRSPDRATVDLEYFLGPNARIDSTVEAATVHLQAGPRIHDWKHDLVIKAFNDLDTVFFVGIARKKSKR